MKQIGQAFLLYANESRYRYPPDLQTTLATQDLTQEAFVCPEHWNFDRATTRFASDSAARAAKNLDYIYVGEGLTNSVSPDEPVLFERLSDHDHGGNVLFGDGHVDFYSREAILKLLEPLRNTPRLTDEEYNAIVAN